MQLNWKINYTSLSLPLLSRFGVSIKCFLKSLKRKQDEKSKYFVQLLIKTKC